MRRPSSGNKHDHVGGAEQRERKEGCEFEHCQKVRLMGKDRLSYSLCKKLADRFLGMLTRAD